MNKIVIDVPQRKIIEMVLDREGQGEELKMIISGEEKGLYEVFVEIRHIAKNTRGRVTVKAVAREGQIIKSKGVVKIQKGADGTDDFLELRGMMIDEGMVEVEPVMEILANEVKASHAASVGRIDEEQLWYLMSRGLSRKEAEELVVAGFVKDG